MAAEGGSVQSGVENVSVSGKKELHVRTHDYDGQ